MSIWLILVYVAIAACVLIVAFLFGRRVARRESTMESSNSSFSDSEFGSDDGWLRRSLDADGLQRCIAIMPDALALVTSQGLIRYLSPGARVLNIADGDRLNVHELADIMRLAILDEEIHEGDVQLPILQQVSGKASSQSRRGEVGKPQYSPQDKRYVHVRIGNVNDDVYAIFLDDISERRHFEDMRRDFVTNVSHELKTPTGAISLLAETIADAADDQDAVRYFAGRISSESERLTALVQRLIELQRAQSVTAGFGESPVSVSDIVKDAMEQNMMQASAKHISLHMAIRGSMVPLASNDPDDRETSSGEPQSRERRDEVTKMATGTTYATGEVRNDIAVLGNSESLTTAVKNLIENAIRYSSQYASVAVGIDQKNDNVIIRVVDQGSGIPQAALDRIFERFYRVDPARSRQTGGSGLGLSIAKHCVEENGGALSVWSHEGIGSTFTIELPAVHSTTGAVKDT